MNDQQQIADYVLGIMSETEQAAFEYKLDRNLDLKSEVESLRNVYSILQSSEKETEMSSL